MASHSPKNSAWPLATLLLRRLKQIMPSNPVPTDLSSRKGRSGHNPLLGWGFVAVISFHRENISSSDLLWGFLPPEEQSYQRSRNLGLQAHSAAGYPQVQYTLRFARVTQRKGQLGEAPPWNVSPLPGEHPWGRAARAKAKACSHQHPPPTGLHFHTRQRIFWKTVVLKTL